MPVLAATFAAEPGAVQLTLSLYLLGLAVSQLVMGPLSDRFGRRPVVLAGLVLAAVSSVAALAATGIEALIVARVVQAVGASTGAVVGPAIIRDLYDRDRAAAMIGWVTAATVVAPMLAPTIGGFLDTALGWQAIFAFVGLISAATLIGATLSLAETQRTAMRGDLVRFLSEARLLIASPQFCGYTLCVAANSAMFFVYIGGAPHVVVTMMGRSSAVYGVWFGARFDRLHDGKFFRRPDVGTVGGRLRSTMPFGLLSGKLFKSERFALASIEWADPLVDFRPKPTEFLDVRQQLLADCFLIGVRQAGYFRDSQFKRLDHVAPYHAANRIPIPPPPSPATRPR